MDVHEMHSDFWGRTNWLPAAYNYWIDACQRVILFTDILHSKIGHLGIFVGSKVARKEHAAIIGTVDMIEYLAPGLYEMVITGEPSKPWLNDHKVEFVERNMEDILKLDEGPLPRREKERSG